MIGAYMKFPEDARKSKKLDIKAGYMPNLKKATSFFDNLIAENGEDSRKNAIKPLIIKGLGRLSRKTSYSLKGIETPFEHRVDAVEIR